MDEKQMEQQKTLSFDAWFDAEFETENGFVSSGDPMFYDSMLRCKAWALKAWKKATLNTQASTLLKEPAVNMAPMQRELVAWLRNEARREDANWNTLRAKRFIDAANFMEATTLNVSMSAAALATPLQEPVAYDGTATEGGARYQADQHLRALLRYTEGFYGVAIEHGMKAGETANAIAHIEKSARALHELVHAWSDVAKQRHTTSPAGQPAVPKIAEAFKACKKGGREFDYFEQGYRAAFTDLYEGGDQA
jgi:hypothetical protein